ncbi:MAG TPA: hypothetical protein PKL06_08550 [Chitinophagales bacterium]|nr:hypothetical protein [Chitinophagales bacterium]
MKRTILCSLLFCIHLIGAQAQSRLYDFIQPGDFQVGYMDTLLFDWPYTYTAYNYTGKKPYVVQVWFPLTEKIEQPEYLTFKDFFEMPAATHWQAFKQTCKHTIGMPLSEIALKKT